VCEGDLVRHRRGSDDAGRRLTATDESLPSGAIDEVVGFAAPTKVPKIYQVRAPVIGYVLSFALPAPKAQRERRSRQCIEQFFAA